jgi:hypothetical protein
MNGVRVPAQLPPELAEGDALRLRVAEAGAERVVLQVVQPGAPSAAPGATPPAAAELRAALAAATGRTATVTVRDREETLDVRA